MLGKDFWNFIGWYYSICYLGHFDRYFIFRCFFFFGIDLSANPTTRNDGLLQFPMLSANSELQAN